MATKLVAVAGGEYGVAPRMVDPVTGQLLWQGRHIIDEGAICIRDTPSTLFIVDDEQRCLRISLDGAVLREGYFGHDTAFSTAVFDAVKAVYPTVETGTQPGSAYVYMGISQNPNGYGHKVYYNATDNKFIVAITSYSLGTSDGQNWLNMPADTYFPWGVSFNYDFVTGAYTNMALIGADATNNKDNMNGAYIQVAYSTKLIVHTSNVSSLFVVDTDTNAMDRYPLNMSYLSQNYKPFYPYGYVDPDFVSPYFIHDYNNIYKIPDIAAFVAQVVAGTITNWTTFQALYSPFTTTTDFTTWPAHDNRPNDWAGMKGKVMDPLANTSDSAMSYDPVANCMYFPYQANNSAPYTLAFVKWNLADDTFELLMNQVVARPEWVLTGYGEDDNQGNPGKIRVTDTHLFAYTDAGIARYLLADGTYTHHSFVGDDDEDWTTHIWWFELPTFTVSASVTKAPDNTLNVLMYDQTTGQHLREQEVTGSETIECFTNQPKFLVCRSPNGSSNYQIAAHLTPTATA